MGTSALEYPDKYNLEDTLEHISEKEIFNIIENSQVEFEQTVNDLSAQVSTPYRVSARFNNGERLCMRR